MSGSSPLPRVPVPLRWLAARAYGLGVGVEATRRRRGRKTLPIPVVSIGNMTVGGTGKSPMVLAFARALCVAGARPAIAMRGYRSSATGGSDEAAEYADRLPEVPLLIGPNRWQVVKDRLAQSPGAFDIVLLDDGFQHHRLARDLDIVLVDASRCGLDGDVLPNGWLREPARGLARADTVVVTHAADAGDGLEAVQRLITTYHGKEAEVVTSHAWERLDCYVKGQRAESTAPNSVVAACGIGHPEAFFAQAQRMGLHLAGRESFEDHAAFDAARVDRLLRSARAVDGLLLTHKDWVKLRRAEAIAACEIPIFVPKLELVFEQGADSLAKQLSALSGHAVRL